MLFEFRKQCQSSFTSYMPAVQLIESAQSDLRSMIDQYFDVKPVEAAEVAVVPTAAKYTLVLDMDETLIHFNQRTGKFKVRPGVPQFLESVA